MGGNCSKAQKVADDTTEIGLDPVEVTRLVTETLAASTVSPVMPVEKQLNRSAGNVLCSCLSVLNH